MNTYLNRILYEGSTLGNRPVHRDRGWIVRARERTGAGAVPSAETVTHLAVVGRRCTNRDNRARVFPATSRLHCATGSMSHRQEILRLECRGIGLVSGRRNSVRDSAIITPFCPYILNACSTVLRGSCGNGVTRTGGPGKSLGRTVTSAVDSERETCGSCLDSHLNCRSRCRGLDPDRDWRAGLKETYRSSCGLRRLISIESEIIQCTPANRIRVLILCKCLRCPCQ